MSETKREAESPARAPRPQKKAKFTPSGKGIKETDVGITVYLSQELAGFSGDLKQRYTDFLVNEIDMNGNVLHLSDDGIMDKKQRRLERRKQERAEKAAAEAAIEEANKETPDQISEESTNQDSKIEEVPEIIGEAATEKKTDEPKPFEIDPEKKIKMIETFGEEDFVQIENLLKTPPRTPAEFHSEKVFNDRQARGAIHQLVRESFESRIETKTTPKNTFHFVLVLGNRPNRPQKKQQTDPEDTKDENGVENWGLGPHKDFLHFNLYKENKDTMEAANIISRLLRVPSKYIRFAGTKDRRACTVQRLCLNRFKVERVNALNKALRGMKLGGFSYEDTSLSLGDLKGNEFLITLRDVKSYDASKSVEEVVESSISALRERGFINYYGMQRFGTFSISTHTVGKEILLNNWNKTANLILSVQELVLPDSIKGRKIWEESKDAHNALENMPKKCLAEWTILNHLSGCTKNETGDYDDIDYLYAIMKIPRNLRIMYGHAYQSYVWNCVASRRIELFGMNVVVGDLVIDDTSSETQNEGTAEAAIKEEDDFEEDVRTDKYVRARAVTQEEVDSGKFSIYDVVLPLPGFDVNYPSNEELVNVYKAVMEQDGLDPLQMTRKVKEFSFAGSYRAVVGKPKQIDHFIRHYRSPTQQLLYTDLELLEKAKHGHPNIEQIIKDKGGDRTAVIIKLQLESSAYATMALREIMKADTSRHGEMCDVKIHEENIQAETIQEQKIEDETIQEEKIQEE